MYYEYTYVLMIYDVGKIYIPSRFASLSSILLFNFPVFMLLLNKFHSKALDLTSLILPMQ